MKNILVSFLKVFLSVLGVLALSVVGIFTFATIADDDQGPYLNDSIDLFDQSLVHTIVIDITQDDYEEMVETYQNDGEKEWKKVDIIIDGISISDVGIRLKGNSTLRSILGGVGSEDGFPEGAPMMRGDDDFAGREWNQEKDHGGIMTSAEIPPFLIRFDKYVDDQTYQGVTEIALRVGNNATLLSEPVAFALHKTMGQVVPDTSLAAGLIGDHGPQLYVVTEHPTDEYVEKYFPGEKGYLYKAGNFVGFTYRGEDEEDYEDIYEEKNRG